MLLLDPSTRVVSVRHALEEDGGKVSFVFFFGFLFHPLHFDLTVTLHFFLPSMSVFHFLGLIGELVLSTRVGKTHFVSSVECADDCTVRRQPFTSFSATFWYLSPAR